MSKAKKALKIFLAVFVLFWMILIAQHIYVHSMHPTSTTKTSSYQSTGPDIVVYVTGADGTKFSGAISITSGTKVTQKSVDGEVSKKYEFNNIDYISVTFQKETGRSNLLKVTIYDPQSDQVIAEDYTTASYGVVSLGVEDPT